MSYVHLLLRIGLYICLAWMVKSMQECPQAAEGLGKRFCSVNQPFFFTKKTVTKEASHKGLESNWAGLALLLLCAKP